MNIGRVYTPPMFIARCIDRGEAVNLIVAGV